MHRKPLEIGLAPAPEMEPAGQLVGEVAHEINSLPTAVSGSALRLHARAQNYRTITARHLAQIICAAERAAELTRQLLARLAATTAELMSIDLAEAIRRLEPTIRLLLAGDIVLDFRHDQPAPPQCSWSPPGLSRFS